MTETTTLHASGPPGPKGLPWFGSIGDLRRNPMQFFTDISQRYGGIVRYHYGRKPTYLISDPDLIKEFLVDHHADYVKNRRYAVLERTIGNGLLTSEGETWKRQRRATQDGLHRRLIKSQVPSTVALVTEHLDRWDSIAGQRTAHDIEPDVTLIVEYLIGCWVFGPTFRSDFGARFTSLIGSLRDNWPEQPKRLIEVKLPPVRRVRRLKKTLGEIEDIVFGFIRRHREEDTENFSLLSSLANARFGDTEESFTDRELRDQLLTLFLAGFETSASLLTFLFYRLSLQPEVRRRLFDEIDTVLEGRSPSADDLPKLEYTERCLNETLRLYPPAYNFTRIALREHTIGGYRIPEDSMVIVSPYATHRLPDHWPNPEGFDPERFSPEQCEGRSPFAFIPFGAGHRFCVGAALAQMQTKVITALVCQRFQLDVQVGYAAEPVPGTVMRPAGGMPMIVQSRSDAPRRSASGSESGP